VAGPNRVFAGIRRPGNRPTHPDKIKRFFVDEVLFGSLQRGGKAYADIDHDDGSSRWMQEQLERKDHADLPAR
jgi:ATP-dependent Clp protease ATP-binding subunit ClpA